MRPPRLKHLPPHQILLMLSAVCLLVFLIGTAIAVFETLDAREAREVAQSLKPTQPAKPAAPRVPATKPAAPKS